MGYYCTVPQCTSLAGKTKNVKFHRFPRDTTMADKWNIILKRGKPYTKYSKVCSLHFTQADYNVTAMGQWKTLSKDAVPSQNLPKLNPDGTVMVIRKSRTVKYKEAKKDDSVCEKERWSSMIHTQTPLACSPDKQGIVESQNSILAYRLQGLNAIQQNIPPIADEKPKKQDAIMQTDPITDDENPISFDTDKFEVYPSEYMKGSKDFMPQTNEEYNKEAEKYALERKNFEKMEYQKSVDYQKSMEYQKCDKMDYQKTMEYQKPEKMEYKCYDKSTEYPKTGDVEYEKTLDLDKDGMEKDMEMKGMEYQKVEYDYYYQDSVEMLRNQQQNLQLLQEQHRANENQNFFDENHIKQEIEFANDDEKFVFERSKERVGQTMFDEQRRLMEQQRLVEDMSQTVKQEPETTNNNGHEIMHPQNSPYFATDEQNNVNGKFSPLHSVRQSRYPFVCVCIWQNTMKRPFFYSEANHYPAPHALHRYEDLTRILQ
ncbi:uncharacterized protein LOC119838102 [Zerene cesonia]|uniref:uncharacterized protein LOC119838102 n=1 Tax=Zerene cesonia TaxID=33412 RepID=UPI0018E4FCD8|nr:uncharacterized protein LOC119838102 [Zerene cesonia]